MCGITGFIDISAQVDNLERSTIIKKMSDALIHRGPDDSGYWFDNEAGVAIGHRRLSIIDLTSGGKQPMVSTSGRYILAYNGEIYNYQSIKKELLKKGIKFYGNSDTEVLLASIDYWGLLPAIERFIGMFAFALWDRQERMIHLVRDRLGKKPLYYGWSKQTFVFGSELKALTAYPGFEKKINRQALSSQIRYSAVPAPLCIYEDLWKLRPGCVISIPYENIKNHALPTQQKYWSPIDNAYDNENSLATHDESEIEEQFKQLASDAVKMRMISDVPLGAFLSGGVDSSTIVALMQSQCEKPVKTFTIGFQQESYDEAPYARAIARHLGTDHHEYYVTSEEALSVIPNLPRLWDEPFSDSSQIPTYLISKIARNDVTVCLSGDGGDELCGGYNRHIWARKIWNSTKSLPLPAREIISKLITITSPLLLNNLGDRLRPIISVPRAPGEKLYKAARMITAVHTDEIYDLLISHWTEFDPVVTDTEEKFPVNYLEMELPESYEMIEKIILMDFIRYLPDDILTKVDRASMGVSLEARTPFLDHRLVEFALIIPLNLKIRTGKSKRLLRQLLYQYVPETLIERPKAGFEIPLDVWLRGPLREWAEDLLDKNRLKHEGYFDVEKISKCWQEHISGNKNWQHYLWDILMFEEWHDYWIKNTN